jgi:hypothetical protein
MVGGADFAGRGIALRIGGGGGVHDEAYEILDHQGHEESRRPLALNVSLVFLGALDGNRSRKLHPD